MERGPVRIVWLAWAVVASACSANGYRETSTGGDVPDGALDEAALLAREHEQWCPRLTDYFERGDLSAPPWAAGGPCRPGASCGGTRVLVCAGGFGLRTWSCLCGFDGNQTCDHRDYCDAGPLDGAAPPPDAPPPDARPDASDGAGAGGADAAASPLDAAADAADAAGG